MSVAAFGMDMVDVRLLGASMSSVLELQQLSGLQLLLQLK